MTHGSREDCQLQRGRAVSGADRRARSKNPRPRRETLQRGRAVSGADRGPPGPAARARAEVASTGPRRLRRGQPLPLGLDKTPVTWLQRGRAVSGADRSTVDHRTRFRHPTLQPGRAVSGADSDSPDNRHAVRADGFSGAAPSPARTVRVLHERRRQHVRPASTGPRRLRRGQSLGCATSSTSAAGRFNGAAPSPARTVGTHRLAACGDRDEASTGPRRLRRGQSGYGRAASSRSRWLQRVRAVSGADRSLPQASASAAFRTSTGPRRLRRGQWRRR